MKSRTSLQRECACCLVFETGVVIGTYNVYIWPPGSSRVHAEPPRRPKHVLACLSSIQTLILVQMQVADMGH